MPIYDYCCVDCGFRVQQLTGLHDATGLCPECGGLMLRLDEDIFQLYLASRREGRETGGPERTDFPKILGEILKKIFAEEDGL